MRNLLYLFVSLFMVFTIQSCKRMGDDDGNLLNDMGINNGLLGEDRFLHQEVTSADTIAYYKYSGRKLVKVLGKKAITNITYSGDLINKIDYNGIVNGDSISYTQLFNYSVNQPQRLTNITETKSVYVDIVGQHNIVPPVPLVANKSKAIYEITFGANGKLQSYLKKTGADVPLTTFAFTSYEKTDYSYDSKLNVNKAKTSYGTIAGSILNPPTYTVSYDFSNYDDRRSPYTLLPFGYLLHRSFVNGFNNYKFSPSNPKRVMVSGDLIPIPIPYNTIYTYDHLGFALTGWGTNYDYRAF